MSVVPSIFRVNIVLFVTPVAPSVLIVKRRCQAGMAIPASGVIEEDPPDGFGFADGSFPLTIEWIEPFFNSKHIGHDDDVIDINGPGKIKLQCFMRSYLQRFGGTFNARLLLSLALHNADPLVVEFELDGMPRYSDQLASWRLNATGANAP